MKQRLHADFLARAVAEITGAEPSELMDTDKDGAYFDLGSWQTQLRILRARIRREKQEQKHVEEPHSTERGDAADRST